MSCCPALEYLSQPVPPAGKVSKKSLKSRLPASFLLRSGNTRLIQTSHEGSVALIYLSAWRWSRERPRSRPHWCRSALNCCFLSAVCWSLFLKVYRNYRKTLKSLLLLTVYRCLVKKLFLTAMMNTWEMEWTSGWAPPPPNTTLSINVCVCMCGKLQISGTDNHLWPEVGVHHPHHHQECPAEDVLPVPALGRLIHFCSAVIQSVIVIWWSLLFFMNYIDFSHHVTRMNQFCGFMFHSLCFPCFQLMNMSNSVKAAWSTESNLNTLSSACVCSHTGSVGWSTVAEWNR